MKVILERDAFLDVLTHVQGIVERRNTIAILSNVLLVAENGVLSVVATNLDIEMRERVAAEIAADGAITASAHKLHDIVRELPEGAQIELSAEADAASLTLVSGKSVFSLQALPQADFPVMPADDLPVAFALPAADLRRLIAKTQFAISDAETRRYLNGLYLHAVEEEGAALLRAVATDTHRLALAQVPQPVGAADMPAIIVPAKTVGELYRLLSDDTGEVSVALSATRISFTFDQVGFTSKLIDGAYPDYARVIPTAHDKTFSVDKADFIQVVNRVAAISSEKSRAVKLSVDDGKVVFSVSHPDSGSANDELAAADANAAAEIGFNARYLVDIARRIDGARAIFEFSGPDEATLMRDSDDSDSLYVIMPMRV